ncbi:hypothetical protein Rcae01_00731 [Novipirellula caenicola]|uniref:Uncharacterized protein n=1 Tax=Novipirellula caenicola TaxID=1536901 RepID=A0ABP9VJA8_9BACT
MRRSLANHGSERIGDYKVRSDFVVCERQSGTRANIGAGKATMRNHP